MSAAEPRRPILGGDVAFCWKCDRCPARSSYSLRQTADARIVEEWRSTYPTRRVDFARRAGLGSPGLEPADRVRVVQGGIPMASRSRILPTLLAALGVVAALAASAGATGGYETDTAGGGNAQASATPIFQACPSGAPWLRDPNVCESRSSPLPYDKSARDLAVQPTNPNPKLRMSQASLSY